MTGTNVNAQIIQPPRLTGDPSQDVRLIQDWVFRLYQALALTVDLQTFVNQTNQRLDAIEAALATIGGISEATTAHSLSATFSDTEVEGALNALGIRINSLVDAAQEFANES